MHHGGVPLSEGMCDGRSGGDVTHAKPPGMGFPEWIEHLFATERCARKFYKSLAWRRKRSEVLARNHWECRDCKAKSPARYARADTVHHDRFLDKRPDLCLSDTWTDGRGVEREQLIPLCRDCHEARHGRTEGAAARREAFTNAELW